MNKEKQEIQKELNELIAAYYDGSFPQMACDYIHATGMTEEEMEALLEAMKNYIFIGKLKKQFGNTVEK